MSIHDAALRIGRGLLPIALAASLYLYLYPLFHRCYFPLPPHVDTTHPSDLRVAPFRLLALGDPQIEGDSSLPDPDAPVFPSLLDFRPRVHEVGFAEAARTAAATLLRDDVPRLLNGYRKRIDLFGNDYYLAHIYRTLYWWSDPTHVAVLGDLLGSQWIADDEFERRSDRFWHRVFRHGRRVHDNITATPRVEDLGTDAAWKRRIINIAGNHDIGYAGDINEDRIRRFERQFGPVNWETTFRLPSSNVTTSQSLNESHPELRLLVLNSMNLDTPAVDLNLQSQTYDFINDAIGRSRAVEDRSTFTLLLTHIPLHKEAGVCVDAPFFDFFNNDEGGGVKEQNHLSDTASEGILQGIFGMSGDLAAPARGIGRNGLIVNGHDHEGCDVYHHRPREGDSWKAVPWEQSTILTQDRDLPGIRELTLRSMMGEYGGYAGLVSVWFDETAGEWQSDVTMCSAGVQHIWWAVHILDLIAVGFLVGGLCLRIMPKPRAKAINEISVSKGATKHD
ncbi:polarized growth protein [Diplodia corticola]|uniref:Polarized growth protein n=1 Tax=Diplodia corticola TaxID=236234 RepID=A0A1J9RIG3_9PEZI|nr:polarized growth protein [Diplodia corticola]OJD40440.1 polarized growth protein [Diplodia corticola]